MMLWDVPDILRGFRRTEIILRNFKIVWSDKFLIFFKKTLEIKNKYGIRLLTFINARITQLVECDLAKVDAEGSSPFSCSVNHLVFAR